MNARNVALRPALRTVIAGLVLTLATVGLAAVATPAQAASSRIMTMSSDTYEAKVQYWVNVQRGKHGLRKLKLQSCTDGTAERWASYLARSNEFYHQDMSNILNKCNAYYAGETLGRGSISPWRLVKLWMNSPPHRKVLLSRHAQRIGVGSYQDSYGQWVTAANFTKF